MNTMDGRIARILDVNCNRTREALRVIEDFARFGLDDSSLSREAKTLRHDFCQLLVRFGLDDIVKSRDILNDVGTEISTEAEKCRKSTTSAVQAAMKRISESLRSLEEYGKVIHPELGQAFEKCRYRSYELERKICIRNSGREKWGKGGLYVLVTESLCTRSWFETAQAVIRGGAGCLQLREKDLEAGELLERAKCLRELCLENGVLFIMNDRPDLAILAGADGVHVGQEDLSIGEVRRFVGSEHSVGISTHTMDQAESAIECCPDYLAVGPMFATTTKPQDHIPGPELVAAVREKSTIPIVAIGGITRDNVSPVISAGADWICVCSAVISQPDAESATRQLCEKIHKV